MSTIDASQLSEQEYQEFLAFKDFKRNQGQFTANLPRYLVKSSLLGMAHPARLEARSNGVMLDDVLIREGDVLDQAAFGENFQRLLTLGAIEVYYGPDPGPAVIVPAAQKTTIQTTYSPVNGIPMSTLGQPLVPVPVQAPYIVPPKAAPAPGSHSAFIQAALDSVKQAEQTLSQQLAASQPSWQQNLEADVYDGIASVEAITPEGPALHIAETTIAQPVPEPAIGGLPAPAPVVVPVAVAGPVVKAVVKPGTVFKK
jgi:hypothetical protein